MSLPRRFILWTDCADGADQAAWAYWIDAQMTSKLSGMFMAAMNGAAANFVPWTYCAEELDPDLDSFLARKWSEDRTNPEISGM